MVSSLYITEESRILKIRGNMQKQKNAVLIASLINWHFLFHDQCHQLARTRFNFKRPSMTDCTHIHRIAVDLMCCVFVRSCFVIAWWHLGFSLPETLRSLAGITPLVVVHLATVLWTTSKATDQFSAVVFDLCDIFFRLDWIGKKICLTSRWITVPYITHRSSHSAVDVMWYFSMTSFEY